ncbi:hypothetical protein BDN72DRAFT_847990 [Pluteus cervinus]|uniref:Uncharacterized protein n=1 Tax=Pluteus cervinus TaxID=181527 RepID=A0ACD3AC07_9AGAR|nr:hypothetical protein BDN72DRAFT_847990 [Pluteus cervinus]
MAQSYFKARVASPVNDSFADTAFLGLGAEKQLKVEDVQEAYIEQKEKLVAALDGTKTILNEIRSFNREWVVRYPTLREQSQENVEEPAGSSATKRHPLRRSLTFADNPASETEVVLSSPIRRGRRSMTMTCLSDMKEEQLNAEEADDSESLLPTSEFQVLRLDLKLGSHSSANDSASLVSQLEKNSIANLLDERITSSLSHLDKLRLRVEDTSSKVLVTGDLNSGKSTFVNALLRREVMPVDQQPCTTAFCEVHDAAENGGTEEVHVLKEGVTYDVRDEATFTRRTLSDLEEIVVDNEEDHLPKLKVYLADTRAPSESLLNNGVVDISLIDAPGLNRDNTHTTSVFSRQEEIDVVVFVVSSENHFTLSAKEFLLNASKEKAYIFIVVNKFNQIKNKERCRRLVMEQVKEFSPQTYEDAEDLVHFVDSAAALQPCANPAFDDLESSLRSFVLVKRSKSKLQPVSTYLVKVLSDIEFLAAANAVVATTELHNATEELSQVKPVVEKMKTESDSLNTDLTNEEDDRVSAAQSDTRKILSSALDRLSKGLLSVEHPSLSMPEYPGIMSIFDYAREVRRVLLASLDDAIKLAEDTARTTTSDGVNHIKELGDKYLPAGVERNKRVFIPEAMFCLRRTAKGRRRSSVGGAIVAGGSHGLGIGFAQRPELLETTFLDLFDFPYHLWSHFESDEKAKAKEEEESGMPSALSLTGLGLSAMTMLGGQLVGLRGMIECVVRVTQLLESETAKKWAAPVLGALTIGLAGYVVVELPNTIPRTVGRRIRAEIGNLQPVMIVSSGGPRKKDYKRYANGEDEEKGNGEETFLNVHAERIGQETRKVLRLIVWDLKSRFDKALDERKSEVRGAEEEEKKARKAKEWFEEVGKRTGDVRETAMLGSVA